MLHNDSESVIIKALKDLCAVSPPLRQTGSLVIYSPQKDSGGFFLLVVKDMGYTHYWTRSDAAGDKERYATFAQELE